MSVYLILTYNISDPIGFKDYVPGSAPIIRGTLAKHGGELLVADYQSVTLAGEPRDAVVVVRFPDAAAARAWDADPDYAPAKALRLATTTSVSAFIAEGFVPPS